jgi:AraC family transcriptional regulator
VAETFEETRMASERDNLRTDSVSRLCQRPGALIESGRIGGAVPGRATALRYAITTPTRSVHLHLTATLVNRAAVTLVNRAAVELGVPVALAPAVDGSADEFGAALRSLAATAEQGADDLYAETAAQFLAVHLSSPAGDDAGTRYPGREDVRVRRAAAFIRDRLSGSVSLADRAAAARLSPYHFLHVFKQATGITPGRYLTRLRVERAKRLLDRDQQSPGAAKECGFAHPVICRPQPCAKPAYGCR